MTLTKERPIAASIHEVSVHLPGDVYRSVLRDAASNGVTPSVQAARMIADFAGFGDVPEGSIVCDTPEECEQVMKAIVMDALNGR